MSSLRLLRGNNKFNQIKVLARYGKPLNRWQYVTITNFSITPTKTASLKKILTGLSKRKCLNHSQKKTSFIRTRDFLLIIIPFMHMTSDITII